MSSKLIQALFVHLLTASGVLCSLFAFMAIADGNLKLTFIWLGLALIIDAVDGPLARAVDTKTHLPRFSGERLDLIVDYLNYVALPAFIIVKQPVIMGAWGYVAAALVLMTSLFHFSDLSSKTRDGYFVGFPAVWNIVLFYILAFNISQMMAFGAILFFSVLTFIPMCWVHPFRVVKLRWLTGLVVLVWFYAAYVTTLSGFNPVLPYKIMLAGALVYLVALSLRRNLPKIS